MRTFVAVFPPPEVREATLSAARELPISGKIRWTRPSNVHLTLKFLGEVPEDRLPRVLEALETLRGRHGPFGVELSGFGGFPSERRDRALWAGTGRGSEALVSLSADLEDALSSAGFPREKKDYVPHLTLGRSARHPIRLETVEGPPGIPGFWVEKITLVKSELSAAGAVYSVFGRYPLCGALTPEADRE